MKLDSGRTYRVQLDGTQAQLTFMWHFGRLMTCADGYTA